MRTLKKVKAVTFDVEPGSTIRASIHDAIHYARVTDGGSRDESRILVSFEFEGITISVKSDSDPILIYQEWMLASDGHRGTRVGPYPAALTGSVEWQAKEGTCEEQWEHAVQAKLAHAPVMEISDEKRWQSYQVSHRDGCSKRGVIKYAEYLARQMQAELAKDQKLGDVAESVLEEASFFRVTPLMQEQAIKILIHCWNHGQELRKWYVTWRKQTTPTGKEEPPGC